MTICTDEFGSLGRREAESLGMPWLPMALVAHPLGGQKPPAIREKAASALDQVVTILTASEHDLMTRFAEAV